MFNCDQSSEPLRNSNETDMRQKVRGKLYRIPSKWKRKKSVTYEKGDLVLWPDASKDNKEVKKKLKMKYGGPYRVTWVLRNDCYEITPIKGIKGYKKFKTVTAAESISKYSNKLDSSTNTDSDVNSTDELIDLLES